MQINGNNFRESFFQESAGHRVEMKAGLLGLEQGSFDPELLNGIFRDAHSVKGAPTTEYFVAANSEKLHWMQLLDPVAQAINQLRSSE